jgi:hypothetical protein
MVFAILVMFSALSLATVAAYFSIVGLTTIFPGAFWSIFIMGTTLEVGKLVTAVWLHRNWKKSQRLIKFYLTFSVVVLSLITSMGIFGFLSKSHIEQESGSSSISSQISILDNKLNAIEIKKQSTQKQIESINKQKQEDTDFILKMNERLLVLDSLVAEVRSKGGFSVSKKVAEVQESQQNERSSIINNKLNCQNRINSYISKIEEQLFPKLESLDEESLVIVLDKTKLDSEIKKIEAEIGPIKYIAEIVSDFGGPNVDSSAAVRMVILILIFVFDPLAILLVVASSSTFKSLSGGESKDIIEFRNNLLIELEMHLADGKPVDSFIDKYKI